ncbi:nitroreductase [Gottschalkia acidurici 9a]|uniref:Nitroreductase n=1 Tax=Gottschalkia acidurici (strain ATCC 7906 / DSM 604 / BCRC 14475 / CIP 104303 / KCTC 5404 / NCIMB 10678 / 9a) TaxID=1128398 RepID=K0AZF6_GOTA9|nr:nitroreductase family protein [Gottschalkia acidurici]AFS79183.1 nitroreductase [Gottschalkia acidurici 9a]
MSKDFYKAVKDRRSIRELIKESTVSDERILEIIENAILHTPSAFNSQTARVVVLFRDHHDKLWDIVKESLRKIVPEEKFSPTEKKINSFKNGYGTILFFEDISIVKSLQEQFPTYKHNFPDWSQQGSGMNQFVIWTSLAVEGLGASLQHYNELIKDEVKKEWNIPESWELISQMPFGRFTEQAGEKEFMPIEERLKVFK